MDPFYKRSGFGGLVLFVGTLLIYWAVDGVAPGSADWVQALVLALGVAGYQAARPTVPLSEAARMQKLITLQEAHLEVHRRAAEGQRP